MEDDFLTFLSGSKPVDAPPVNELNKVCEGVLTGSFSVDFDCRNESDATRLSRSAVGPNEGEL